VVLADPGRLEEVLLNLLTNAVTHAPASQLVEVTVARDRDQATVRVRDEGPGIPAGQLAQLFTRFSRAPRGDGQRRRGLGLGLYISRELMRAQGGTIDVASIEGSGTTVTVRLPMMALRSEARVSPLSTERTRG
jgi:signal transduction histidine kinase